MTAEIRLLWKKIKLLQEIFQWCTKHDCKIFLDNIYELTKIQELKIMTKNIQGTNTC
jgi:hypothetical protein